MSSKLLDFIRSYSMIALVVFKKAMDYYPNILIKVILTLHFLHKKMSQGLKSQIFMEIMTLQHFWLNFRFKFYHLTSRIFPFSILKEVRNSLSSSSFKQINKDLVLIVNSFVNDRISNEWSQLSHHMSGINSCLNQDLWFYFQTP